VVENVRPPVAIRIVRPYSTEDELLEHELDTIGKTSVVLIGAHPRPTGVILRFEVTLASGATVLRGEGRVLAHNENAFRGQAGLSLRFTRLDPKSKGVVDRATMLREGRQAEAGGSPSRLAPQPEGPIAEALTAATPAPSATTPSANADQEAAVERIRASAREKANATARANARRTGGSVPPSGKAAALTPPPLPVVDATPTPVPPTPMPMPPPAEPTPVTSVPGAVQETLTARPPAPVESAAPTGPPPDRAELLARLRDRAEKLDPARVQEILASRH
jgi:hypothetical protein